MSLLSALALAFPNIDPVLIHLGPLAIRWYSLAYIAGFVLGWQLIKKLNARPRHHPYEGEAPPPVLSKAAFDDLLIYAILGVILGGRIGYVLFYNPGFYFSQPLEIPKIWQGGMSFHGGFLGVLAAMFLLARRHKMQFWELMDLLAVATPIGLFFGRIANFINGELYGRTTDVAWAVFFPRGGELPRHPSQLYEAALEGALLFAVLVTLAFRTRIREHPAALSGIFLGGYGAARAFVECFREPDQQLGFLTFGLTMGQWLSLPMVFLGILLTLWALRRNKELLSRGLTGATTSMTTDSALKAQDDSK